MVGFKTEKLLALLAFIVGLTSILFNLGSIMFFNSFPNPPQFINILSVEGIPIKHIRTNSVFLAGYGLMKAIGLIITFIYFYAYKKLTELNYKEIGITLLVSGAIGYRVASEMAGIFAILSGILIFISVNKQKQ